MNDSSMVFSIGPWTVPVFVSDQRPMDRRGVRHDALIDFEGPQILLWSGLGGRRRRQALWHELWHLKRHHLGACQEMEVDCKLASAFIEEMQTQLDDQGGLAALDALRPLGCAAQGLPTVSIEDPAADPELAVVDEAEHGGWRVRELRLVGVGDEFPDDPGEGRDEDLAALRPEGRLGGRPSADCCNRACGREFFASSVFTSAPRMCHSVAGRVVGGDVVERELYCPTCEHVQRWLEGWDPVTGAPNGVVVALLGVSVDAEAIDAHLERLRDQQAAALAWSG